VATIVVYAGAIVVTFLFVVMLAQPEGHDPYDRISWGALAKPVAVISAALLVGVLALSLASVRGAPPHVATGAKPALAAQRHMASLGNELFSKHLLAVEVAGTLLLVALVGAIAIVIQGQKAAAAGEVSSHE
jgi:NADH-quinone oxidoreductase subunit J